jgi:hypothetical protein
VSKSAGQTDGSMVAHDISHENGEGHGHDKAAKGKLSERRFLAEATTRTNVQSLVGGLGAAALGAGVYAAWAHDVPMAATPYWFGAAAVGILGAWALGSADSSPLRVGDAGVGTERGGDQPDRLAWWQIEKVSADDRAVVVEGDGRRIVASLGFHPAAAALIVKEALNRIPKKVAIEGDKRDALLRGADSHSGTAVALEPVQVAGRRCKASGAIISFEREAIVCSRCGEVYDRRHVPAACLTCDAPMPPA